MTGRLRAGLGSLPGDTIVLSWLGLAAFYDLLRQENLGSRTAAFATAVLALNPLFFLLEGTFMTDVPALSFALVALALYGRAIKSGDWRRESPSHRGHRDHREMQHCTGKPKTSSSTTEQLGAVSLLGGL
jgi:hypothetical protein